MVLAATRRNSVSIAMVARQEVMDLVAKSGKFDPTFVGFTGYNGLLYEEGRYNYGIRAEGFNMKKSGDRHQPTTQQSSPRNHGHNNDRYGSDRRGGGDNHRSSNNNYSGNNN
nr:hypothetical protein [Tanacetum cinerariifolium]